VDVEVTGGAAAFIEQASGFLLEAEARHNLAFGIVSFALDHPDVYGEVRGWVVRDAGDVVGAALRTPPYNLVLARPAMPGALEALAGSIPEELPGVVGAVPEVDGFASAWSALHGVTPTTRFDQRICARPNAMRLRFRIAWTATCGSSAHAWTQSSPPEAPGSRASPTKRGRA
jgi:hypothetical protein